VMTKQIGICDRVHGLSPVALSNYARPQRALLEERLVITLRKSCETPACLRKACVLAHLRFH